MKKLRTKSYTDEQIKFIKDLVTEGLDWQDITDAFNGMFDTKKTLKALQNKYYTVQDYDLSDDEMLLNIRAAHSAKKASSRVRKENRLVLDALQEREEFLDELLSINSIIPIKMHPKVKIKRRGTPSRSVVAHISDTHIGVNINEEEMGGTNKFNSTIAARRFAMFFFEIANYKLDHRKDTELVLVLNGDILAGVIHNQEHVVDRMSTQFSSALRILSQGISFLSQHFADIRVICTTGNHDRRMHKADKGRASADKWDSFSIDLYISLRERFVEYDNINFTIPVTPYALFKVQGHNFFATHGDTIINIGNVSKKIEFKNLKDQINDISIALDTKLHVVMVGHVHKQTYQTLDNGTELLINNSLSGVDTFAQSIGILKGVKSQQLIEVTSDFPVGDLRSVRLDKADDNDELDQIVEPMARLF